MTVDLTCAHDFILVINLLVLCDLKRIVVCSRNCSLDVISMNDQNEWKNYCKWHSGWKLPFLLWPAFFFVSNRSNCTCRLTLRVRFPQVVVFGRCVLTQIQITKPILDNPKCHNISKLIWCKGKCFPVFIAAFYIYFLTCF